MAKDKHDKAHDLAEEALDKAERGDREKAREMVEEARNLDPDAVEEVANEVDAEKDEAEHFRSRK